MFFQYFISSGANLPDEPVLGANVHEFFSHEGSLEGPIQRASYALGWQFASLGCDRISTFTESSFSDWLKNENWSAINTITISEFFDKRQLLSIIGSSVTIPCKKCDHVATNAPKDFSKANW